LLILAEVVDTLVAVADMVVAELVEILKFDIYKI
jgi:hypothetical protein